MNPKGANIIITDQLFNSNEQRKKICEIMFEKFQVRAVNFTLPSVFLLNAAGVNSGTVLDSGEGVTTVVPINQGKIVKGAARKLDLAGVDLNKNLALIFSERGYCFSKSPEMEIIRNIKEKFGSLSMNYEFDVSGGLHEDEKSFMIPDGQVCKIFSIARYVINYEKRHNLKVPC